MNEPSSIMPLASPSNTSFPPPDPSRSRESLSSDRRQALTQSFAIHFGLFLCFFAAAFLPLWVNSTPPSENLPLEVIDAPRAAPLPLQPVRPERTKPPESQKKPRAIFGLSRDHLASSDANAPSSKLGNTLAKTPDQDRLRDDDPSAIPIPTDDYLVSEMPVLLSDFRVPYPADAKKAGVQGSVMLDLLIDGEGLVRKATLVQGLFPSLDQAAQTAALQLRFKPARVEQKPVAVRIRYAYRFVLE